MMSVVQRQTRTYPAAKSLVLLTLIGVVACGGCRKSEPAPTAKSEPAQVAHHVEESSLNTITLTPEAAERLGIQLATTELGEVQRQRSIGGEVVLPPGQLIIVSAPIAGTLSAATGQPALVPGQRVQAGQELFQFTPMLTPERDVLTPSERVRMAQTKADIATAQIEAERQIETAKVAVEMAQTEYDRAVKMLEIKAGSQQTVDQAEGNLKLAQEAIETAKVRYKFLSGIQLDEQPGELASRAVVSPVSGVLQGLESAAGETVSAGDAIFSVMKTDRLWIRVPVYVGQWRTIDTSELAVATEYGQQPGVESRTARYVSAPPTANANATTVDVYYELDNQQADLYPGQVLSVTVPLHHRAESLTVPFRAILYDINGGAWVYEQVEPLVFARRRVSVEYVAGGKAVLVEGPLPGSKVVTDGAVELFGTEFGVGH